MLHPPRGFGVVTTIGRKSGKRRRRCVRVVRVENTAYLTSIRGSKAGWLRKLRAYPTVWLRIRGGTFEGSARELHADEVDAARRAYCETLNPLDLIEYLLHMPGWPTRERIKALHEHWFTTGAPLAIELKAAAAEERAPRKNRDHKDTSLTRRWGRPPHLHPRGWPIPTTPRVSNRRFKGMAVMSALALSVLEPTRELARLRGVRGATPRARPDLGRVGGHRVLDTIGLGLVLFVTSSMGEVLDSMASPPSGSPTSGSLSRQCYPYVPPATRLARQCLWPDPLRLVHAL